MKKYSDIYSFDSTGKRLILPGDTVRVIHDDWYFNENFGTVVSCKHEREDSEPEYSISVYYGQEASSGGFPDWPGVSTWDREINNWKIPATRLIQDRDLRLICPRIVTYRPEDLRVLEPGEWDINETGKRGSLPGGACWQTFTFKDMPFYPGLYPCQEPGCENVATDVAWANIWGSMYSVYTCADCFPKIHAGRGDDLPPLDTKDAFAHCTHPRSA